MHCFVCGSPAHSYRSLTQLTAPPAGPRDAVPLCPDCSEHWTAALHVILCTDLQQSPPNPTKRETP